jgi:O-antigen/teichoic acid export membrane protein
MFGSAKAAALVGLLWLASVAEPSLYGVVELGLAVSLIVSTLAMLGLPALITREALVGDETNISDLLSFCALVVAVPCTIFSVASSLASQGKSAPGLIAAVCALMAFQTVGSVYARIRGPRILTSVTDPYATLIVLMSCVLLWWGADLRMEFLSLTLGVSAVGTVVFLGACFARTKREDFLRRYVHLIPAALPLLALGVAAVVIGAGLRPVLAARLDLEQLAIYSLAFRLMAPCLLLHQVCQTAFFRQLYRMSDTQFSFVLSGVIGMCVTLVIVIWLLLPQILTYGFSDYLAVSAEMSATLPLVGAQVILWISAAFMEMRVSRHGGAASVALASCVLLSAFVVILLLHPAPSLAFAVLAFDISLLAILLAQALILRRKGSNGWAAFLGGGLSLMLLATLTATT